MAALEPTHESLFIPPASDRIREANHRIANHLSMIVSMVQIQASALARGPEVLTRADVHDMLQDVASKVFSVSHLHRKLANSPHTNEVDIGAYLAESCGNMMMSLSLRRRAAIVYRLGQKCIVSTEKAQIVALIVNEIVMNAIKHAHPTNISAYITIDCGRDPTGQMCIEITDDGVGLPENFDCGKDGGVGFKLIRGLTKQIGAALAIESSSLGLSFRLTLA